MTAATTPLLLAALASAAAGLAGAQEPPRARFGEQQQVTEAEILLEFERGRLGEWLADGEERGPRLQAGDVIVRVGGRDREVVRVERPKTGEGRALDLLVVLDGELCDGPGLRRAAGRLAAAAEQLVAFGRVEVVAVDPDPRVVLPASRDVARVRGALPAVTLWEDSEEPLLALREEFAAAMELLEAEPAYDEAEARAMALAFYDEEVRRVRRRMDRILSRLAEPADGDAQRVLLWVARGFDLTPEELYFSGELPGAIEPLGEDARSWTRAVAAFGWSVLVWPPHTEQVLLRRGFRIGKWRMNWGPSGLAVAHEAERRPESARAYVELAESHFAAGDLQAAEEALTVAIHHFYGDPRVRAELALAWKRLGEVRSQLGEPTRARAAFLNALELDPRLEDVLAAQSQVLPDWQEPLVALVDATAGRVVADAQGVAAALGVAARAQRVSFLLRDAPGGELLPVEVHFPGRELRVRHRGWVRSGAPSRLVLARLRSFLDESLSEPDSLDPRVLEVRTDAGGRSLVLLAGVEEPQSSELHLEVAEGGEVRLLRLRPDRTGGGAWGATLNAPPSDDALAALHFSHQPTEQWRIEPAELVLDGRGEPGATSRQ
jgi:tetratricopeptide (TPR) repeat protein